MIEWKMDEKEKLTVRDSTNDERPSVDELM